MEQRKITVSEDQLKLIISESVKALIKESSTYHELENISSILSGIMKSGFIPFSSPSPSSTEEEIKNAIIEASRNIDKAIYLCTQCGYNEPMANVV
jgi:hypothetical protein